MKLTKLFYYEFVVYFEIALLESKDYILGMSHILNTKTNVEVKIWTM